MKFKSIRNWNLSMIVFASIVIVAVTLSIVFRGSIIRMMNMNIPLTVFILVDAFLLGALWFMLYSDFYIIDKEAVKIHKFFVKKVEIPYDDIKSVTIDIKNIFFNVKKANVVAITYIGKKDKEKRIVAYPEDANVFVAAMQNQAKAIDDASKKAKSEN